MKKIVTDEELYDVANLFKMFADSTRIRILYSLFEKERNVTDIADTLNMNQSAVSHQLKLLNNSKLIKNRRNGKTIYYSLNDDHVNNIIKQGIEHIKE